MTSSLPYLQVLPDDGLWPGGLCPRSPGGGLRGGQRRVEQLSRVDSGDLRAGAGVGPGHVDVLSGDQGDAGAV